MIPLNKQYVVVNVKQLGDLKCKVCKHKYVSWGKPCNTCPPRMIGYGRTKDSFEPDPKLNWNPPHRQDIVNFEMEIVDLKNENNMLKESIAKRGFAYNDS